MSIVEHIKSLNNEWVNSFDLEEWKEVIEFIDNKGLKITTNSIKLSQKIFEETGYKVFPVVYRTYAGRNLLMGGAFSWTMFLRNRNTVGSCYTVKDCLHKENKLFVDKSWKDIELIPENRSKKDEVKE